MNIIVESFRGQQFINLLFGFFSIILKVDFPVVAGEASFSKIGVFCFLSIVPLVEGVDRRVVHVGISVLFSLVVDRARLFLPSSV